MLHERNQFAVSNDIAIYYAKSANQAHGTITNKEHSEKVSQLACKFGEAMGLDKEAGLAGLFHDFGKYSVRFQNVLRGTDIHIDHALPGAALLYKIFCHSKRSPGYLGYKPIIESILGHHDGLVSLLDSNTAIQLEQAVDKDDADNCPSGKLPALRGHAEYQKAAHAFKKDFPGFQFSALSPQAELTDGQVQSMLNTRMLFSCLVDADYSVSAMDDDPAYLEKSTGSALDADLALQKLLDYQSQIQQNSSSAEAVNEIRNAVFDRCGQAASSPVGLFTLTAPTGVGKTLAMMNFALRHCKAYNLQRIIVVLPFLSLAEQTQSVYQNIFPEILVDHSQQVLTEQTRDLAARWAAPVIITTSVRFFESLFSDQPSDCRKLHHIANSVVLFDEAQSLPGKLAKPTVKAVRTLCQNYHCSMVFSTATQPDFSGISNVQWMPWEILPGNAELFQKMRRVCVQWDLKKGTDRKFLSSLTQIAAQMAEEKNVCCIVNLRSHARVLLQQLLQRKSSVDGVYMISTDLCPGHRLELVQEIKERQNSGKPCWVVATQCIEAGVDLDFDVMYRALAPLEAIVQAAGRCNRNGSCQGGGRLVVFEPDEKGELYPEYWYRQAADIVKEMWADDPGLDIQNPKTVQTYYQKLFTRYRGKKELEKALRDENYAEVANAYQLISKRGVPLIVPWVGAAELFQEIAEAERNKTVDMQLLRKAALITITCPDEACIRKFASPLHRVRRGQIEETGYYLVNRGFEDCYDSRWGLQLDSIVTKYLFV